MEREMVAALKVRKPESDEIELKRGGVSLQKVQRRLSRVSRRRASERSFAKYCACAHI